MFKFYVDQFQKSFLNIMIQCFEAVINLIFKPFQKPCFKPANTRFHRGFILRFSDTGRNNGNLIMSCKITIGVVNLRFVQTGMDYRCFAVIRNQNSRKATIPFKSIDMSLIPAKLCFVWKCLYKRIGTVTKCRNKEMCIMDFSGCIINHTWECIANPVNK